MRMVVLKSFLVVAIRNRWYRPHWRSFWGETHWRTRNSTGHLFLKTSSKSAVCVKHPNRFESKHIARMYSRKDIMHANSSEIDLIRNGNKEDIPWGWKSYLFQRWFLRSPLNRFHSFGCFVCRFVGLSSPPIPIWKILLHFLLLAWRFPAKQVTPQRTKIDLHSECALRFNSTQTLRQSKQFHLESHDMHRVHVLPISRLLFKSNRSIIPTF